MNKKGYFLDIKTKGETWFRKSAIYSLAEAKRLFNREDVNELAKGSVIVIGDNLGNIILEKSN
jgi:hypothetical protein